MPLSWTHLGDVKTREIAVNEDVFADIGTYDFFDPGLKLYTNPRTFTANLSNIMKPAKILLRVSDDYGFVEEILLRFKIEFPGGDMQIINKKMLSKV